MYNIRRSFSCGCGFACVCVFLFRCYSYIIIFFYFFCFFSLFGSAYVVCFFPKFYCSSLLLLRFHTTERSSWIDVCVCTKWMVSAIIVSKHFFCVDSSSSTPSPSHITSALFSFILRFSSFIPFHLAYYLSLRFWFLLLTGKHNFWAFVE